MWCSVATSSRKKRSAEARCALRLDEASLGSQHRAECGGRVGPEPAPARADSAHRCLRLLRVALCGGQPSTLDLDQGERGSCNHKARGVPLDGRMLQGPHRNRPRLVDLPGEEEGAGVGGQSCREDLFRAGLRELDRTSTVAHRLTNAAVDRERAHQPRRRLDVGVVGPSCTGRVGELQQPALLDRAAADQHRGGRGRHRKLRMLDGHLVRQRPNPAQQRPAGATSDQRQVILDQELRHEVVIAGCGRMLDRFDGQPSRSQPLGGSSMNPRRRARLERGELNPRVFGEQRVHAEPAASLQPRDQEVRALELVEPGRRIAALEHAVAQLRGELAEDRDAVQKRGLVLVERRENLAAQVVGHETVVSAERSHGPRRVIDGPQPHPGEHQRSGPALGALDEHGDLLLTELEMTENHEQQRASAVSNARSAATHFGERTGGTHPRELEGRIDARDEHDVRVRG